MEQTSLAWMNYSITIAQQADPSLLRTGSVLISKDNKLICSAYTGEKYKLTWCFLLLNKIRELKVSDAESIYVTINTLSQPYVFDLITILEEIHIKKIYIGLPDPTLSNYLDDDPNIKHGCAYRYPDELQHKILELNMRFYAESGQSIKYSPYYSSNRISNLVIANLQLGGFFVSKDELNANKRRLELATLICKKYHLDFSEAMNVVNNAIAEAFNSKYGTYNYSDDTRSLDLSWKERFVSFYKRRFESPLTANCILNVGVGSGHEALTLFSNCTCITFVDIAQAGLAQVKKQIPNARIVVSSADDLSSIPSDSYELYVSLRTYNSSFFDIKGAISEAHRVLKPNAAIIISVANGFLYPEKHCIIPGLIIPGTEFVDIYRGMDTAKLIFTEFTHMGFKDVQLFPTNTEIFVSAITVK